MSIRATIAAILCTAPIVTHAIADSPKQVTIPAGSLAEAIESLARQTGVDVFYGADDLRGRTTQGFSATLSIHAAFEKLLVGTQLTIREEGSSVIIAPRRGPETKSSHVPAAGGALRVAEEQKPLPSRGEGQGEGPDEKKAPSQTVIALEEVVVTGTLIRGSPNETAPVMILDRSYIDASGVSTTTALMQSLPQNFALASQSGVRVPGVTSAGEQGSGLNLRGIGEGTTLVLLNGKRLPLGFGGTAPDISALPLSAIERVEILTDGASATYGSDAVGGVVNFILRDDVDGADTTLRYGGARELNEYRVSQALGTHWSSGNVLGSFEYYRRDLLRAADRSFIPPASIIGSLLPEDKTYSGMFSGKQRLGDSVQLSSDVLFSRRSSFNLGGRTTLNESNEVVNPQLSATFGAGMRLARDWYVEIAGSYGRNELDRTTRGTAFDNALQGGAQTLNSTFDIRSGQIKADGSLFELPAGLIRAAFGADWRHEEYRYRNAFATGLAGLTGDLAQSVRGLFGEIRAPIIGDSNALPGIRRLELSASGRFDDYSRFGSSFDPKIGLLWSPARGLSLRASYGESYVAPRLVDYDISANNAAALTSLDSGSSTGFSRQIWLLGTAVDSLAPQTAENVTMGLRFAPEALPGFETSVNYYRINYKGRIANVPAAAVVLSNPAAFSNLIVRAPTVDQVNAIIAAGRLGQGFLAFNPDFTRDTNFNPATIDVALDLRRRNVSRLSTSGVDLSTEYSADAFGGNARVALSGTYVFELESQATAVAAVLDSVATVYNPPQFRVRSSLGWTRALFSADAFVNHTGYYHDNRTPTVARVASWTTVDLRVALDFSKRFEAGALAGARVAISATNLLDRRPPSIAVLNTLGDMGFDPTNADPTGRLVSLEVMKAW